MKDKNKDNGYSRGERRTTIKDKRQGCKVKNILPNISEEDIANLVGFFIRIGDIKMEDHENINSGIIAIKIDDKFLEKDNEGKVVSKNKWIQINTNEITINDKKYFFELAIQCLVDGYSDVDINRIKSFNNAIICVVKKEKVEDKKAFNYRLNINKNILKTGVSNNFKFEKLNKKANVFKNEDLLDEITNELKQDFIK